MKTFAGALAAVAVVLTVAGFVGLIGFPADAVAQRASLPQNNGELIAFSAATTDKGQQITLIDPKQRVMSVYHVDATTGALSLKSVRNIYYDLQMMDYNVVGLKPEEIRSALNVNSR